MKRLMLIGVIALAGCTNADEATRVLAQTGYSNIQMTGYSLFACSEDDFYHTGFAAKGPSGVPVEGTVCSGFLFKNSTVRIK